MTTSVDFRHQNQASPAEPVDHSWTLPLVTSVYGIDELKEAISNAGWNSDVRQLEAGPLRYGALMGEIGSITCLYECVDRRLEVLTEPYPGVNIVTPIGQNPVQWNGKSVKPGQLMMITPQSTLEAISRGSSAEVLAIGIPAELFERSLDGLGNQRSGLTLGQSIRVGDCAALIDNVMRNVQFALHGPGAGASASALESMIVSSLANLYLQARGNGIARDRYHRLKKRRALARAREYIDGHLDGNIHIPDVCAYAAVSLSTLERVFHRELGVTPSAYIQSRRLNAVRRILLADTDGSHTIAEIAGEYGLHHPGRFSVMFSQQYGISPSDMRRGAGRISSHTASTIHD